MKILEILKLAIDRNASDVILSPNTRPAIKIDGEIVFLENFEVYEKETLNNEILSIMNESQESRFLKNMELDFALEVTGLGRFRGNIFMQKNGFGVVFRPIKSKLQELGLPQRLIDFTKKKSGLIVITGPVGSGKSTTLATLLEHINYNYRKHIITVEDPIEYVFGNKKSIIEQREVGINTENFDNGIKYALRQSSDVIMVGEMRDLETFRLALRAAETGNLVLATMHTSGAAESISRIINMFPNEEKDQIRTQISEVLIGVAWQMLIKKNGGGRCAAMELLVNNTTISNMIRKGLNHQIDGVIETGKEDGMITMKKSLEEIYNNGLISEEYLRELQEISL